jgi:hypothetical protein
MAWEKKLMAWEKKLRARGKTFKIPGKEENEIKILKGFKKTLKVKHVGQTHPKKGGGNRIFAEKLLCIF